jgi:hypothetical protein
VSAFELSPRSSACASQAPCDIARHVPQPATLVPTANSSIHPQAPPRGPGKDVGSPFIQPHLLLEFSFVGAREQRACLIYR